MGIEKFVGAAAAGAAAGAHEALKKSEKEKDFSSAKQEERKWKPKTDADYERMDKCHELINKLAEEGRIISQETAEALEKAQNPEEKKAILLNGLIRREKISLRSYAVSDEGRDGVELSEAELGEIEEKIKEEEAEIIEKVNFIIDNEKDINTLARERLESRNPNKTPEEKEELFRGRYGLYAKEEVAKEMIAKQKESEES
jgi:hypothetical protein